ncbi:hypothetical protein B566_EDAN005508 [Ephemera danica]|nr:hypothetical protein B566_EDAN005508 [Ephemera danica]
MCMRSSIISSHGAAAAGEQASPTKMQRSPTRDISRGQFSFCISVKFGLDETLEVDGPLPLDCQQDLSDDSPEERRAQLPGIEECVTPSDASAAPLPTTTTAAAAVTTLTPAVVGVSLQTPSTPRIDISRASSSSQHEEDEGASGDSRGSTPERELFCGQGGLGFKVYYIQTNGIIHSGKHSDVIGTLYDQGKSAEMTNFIMSMSVNRPCSTVSIKSIVSIKPPLMWLFTIQNARFLAKVDLTWGLCLQEEGAAELRSSTEELDYHEDAQERERRRERLQRRKERGRGSMQPVFKYELEAQSEKERKDSACSLPVSGRTSRLSSVGSAASAASSAASALSVGSRGAMSAVSAATSRSPSPHRMLLETSFCGSKPIPTQSIDLDSPCKHETESLEKLKIQISDADTWDPQVLLSRQTDPTKVVMAVECTPTEATVPAAVSPASVKPASLNLTESGTKLPQSFPAVVETHPAPRIATHVHTKPVRRMPDVQVNGPEPIVEIISLSSPARAPQQEVPSSASPKPARHQHVAVRKAAEEVRSDKGSRTPSPSTSRKSSFTNLFRRTDSPLSPESPTAKRKNAFTSKVKEVSDGLRERSRSRSKSSERSNSVLLDGKTKKDSKNKSVFSSLFKKKSKRSGSTGSGEEVLDSAIGSATTMSPGEESIGSVKLTDSIGVVEFTFSPEPERPRDVIHERVASEDREALDDVGEPPALPAKMQNEPPAQKVEVPPEVEPPKVEPSRPLPDPPPVVDTPTPETQVEPLPLPQHQQLIAEDERQNSSDSEMDRSRDESLAKLHEAIPTHEGEVDHERKTLVMQDSFEDELPYVPTTLPQERSMAVPIVPVRQRLCPEMCPIDRPRSTTPINPANLDDFVQSGPRTGATPPPESERLRISLPREDSLGTARPLKSPHRKTPVAKSWAEFAESGFQSDSRRPSMPSPASPPPLPPRTSPPQNAGTPPPLPPAKSWVNFEEIPERRKPPKKIQTIPNRGPVLEGDAASYSYVKPEDCSCCVDAFGLSGAVARRRCECHGAHHPEERPRRRSSGGGGVASAVVQEQPRLEVQADLAPDRSSVLSDSSYDFSSNPYTVTTTAGSLKPMKPFGMDLDVHSNRSSVISQDEGGSPESPPANGGL